MAKKPCPTCGCEVYRETGPCAGSDDSWLERRGGNRRDWGDIRSGPANERITGHPQAAPGRAMSEEGDYESGPFCRHFGDPSFCDDVCQGCGHGCSRHAAMDGDTECLEDACNCGAWIEADER